jgi:hypothetical protein
MSLNKTKQTPQTIISERKQEQKPAAPAATREVQLTEFQKQFCDTVADMLFNGADEDDFFSMVYGVQAHHYRHRFGPPTGSKEKQDEIVDRLVKDYIDGHLLSLKRSWPDPTHKRAEAAQQNTATERIRAKYRDRLKSEIEIFLCSGIPEEVTFLNEVFCTYRSQYASAVDGVELGLLSAIEEEIDSNRRYVFVPEEHVERVVDFVKLLTKPTKAA